MSKRKVGKGILIGLACTIPVGLVVGLSVNWDHTKTISCIGSGGVKPFIEKFGEAYIKDSQGYDVTVESGGSTFGLTQAAYGYCNIANVSKNPYFDIHDISKITDDWKSEKMKTFTIGWEAIAILYKMPDGLSQEARDNFELVVNPENIHYLYTAFSGFDEEYNGNNIVKINREKTSIYNFLTEEAKAACAPEDINICKSTQIKPYVRSGAATAANTALSFLEESNFTDDEIKLTPNQIEAFIGGQYGEDRTIIQTDESNAKGYENFARDNKPGAMVYVSSAFTENAKTKKIIDEHGYKFMSYQQANGTKCKYEYENIANGYNWFRPLNVCISLDTNKAKNHDTFKFINYIYHGDDGKVYEKILKENGAKPLDDTQIGSMKLNGEWVCDVELEKSRPEQDKKTYGAIW